jgi:hypothetical protein
MPLHVTTLNPFGVVSAVAGKSLAVDDSGFSHTIIALVQLVFSHTSKSDSFAVVARVFLGA